MQKHRVDFGEPANKYASLCSAHLKESCFTCNQSILEGMATSNVRRGLIKGSLPTRDTVLLPSEEEFLTERNKRKVKFKLLQLVKVTCILLHSTFNNEKHYLAIISVFKKRRSCNIGSSPSY